MALAAFKDLCVDTGGSERLGRFWAAALGLEFVSDGGVGWLRGSDQHQRIGMTSVPETKSVKQRVHFDIHTGAIADLVRLGATVLEPGEEFGRRWTVMADPDGGEFCAFVRTQEELPPYRLYELVVDASDARSIAAWWAGVLGGRAETEPQERWWWLEEVPGLPFENLVFQAVPEPKTVKNRIHWHVTCRAPQGLLAEGARTLSVPTPANRWHVMADPEGNEFCVFAGD